MATPTPIAKVSIGKSGYGAAHMSYITRLSALDPERSERASGREQQPDQPSLLATDGRGQAEPTVRETLAETLDERTLDKGKEHGAADLQAADPIWTWNAPSFLTGEEYGTRRDLRSNAASRGGGGVAVSDVRDKLTLNEKVQNVKDYFGSLEDYERRKGGRTHYRIILSFDVPATNQQIRDLTNRFLERAFPKSIAFGAIHRDTEHPHVHLYLNSRQYDGRRIQLKNNDFKTIDEKWATIYAGFAGDRSVYLEYLRKKEETRAWKIAAAEAYRKGEPIPPKPERDNDRRERLAEQRLSAERSQARAEGLQPGARPQAVAISRPASEKETSRLLAKEEVAREMLAHLIRTDAPDKEIKWAARSAQEFSAVLDKTRESRKEMGRERMPLVVYTTEEWKQIKECGRSVDTVVKDEHAAARLQSQRVIAGAELKDAQGKAEAFQASRHFWKFDVEGWDTRLSLKEVEQAIKTKSEERLRLYNFIRPGRRETIRGQIEYLNDVKKEIQKELAGRELAIGRNLGAAQLRYQTAAKQVENSEQARSAQGKEMPPPEYRKEELAKMGTIASRNRDAQLLGYVYDQVRDKLLENPSQEALSRAKGRSVMARMDMFKQAERFRAAAQFADFRQLPRKDEQRLDNTKSIREVSPKNALETIIRHFTDTPEQKTEAKELTDIAGHELRRAEELSIKAKDYSVAVDRILDDYCRSAGASPRQIAPMLNVEEIGQVREFSDKLSIFSSVKKEFTEAARLAELALQRTEATQLARESVDALTHDLSVRSTQQSPTQAPQSIERSDPDSSSRGR
jgi:hypothetical protein